MPKNITIIAKLEDSNGEVMRAGYTFQLVGPNGNIGPSITTKTGDFGFIPGNLLTKFTFNIPNDAYTINVIPINEGMKPEFQYKSTTTITPITISKKELDFGTIILENLTPQITPNTGEEEVPVYLVRSSIPNGPRGQIYFEFRSDGPNKTVLCLGEMDRDTYDTDEVIFTTETEDSTDFNYEKLANSVLSAMNNQINEISGFKEIFGVLSLVQTSTEPPQNFRNYDIAGKVVDSSTQEPLSNVFITDDVKSVGLVGSNINSEPTGDFILRGEYLKDKTFKLTFSLPDYQTKTITPFLNNKFNKLQVQKDLGIVELSFALSSKKTVIEEAPLPDEEVKAITLKEKSKDPMGFAQAEIMQNMIRTAKTVLLPAILALIAKFGIAKAKEILGKNLSEIDFTCPPNIDELNKLIENKNKLTKSLNNLFKTLNGIKVGVEVADKFITVGNIVAQTLSTVILLLPTVPFAPSLSAPLTTKIPKKQGDGVEFKDAIEIIADVLGKMKILSSNLLLILKILIEILQEILNYLALLDLLIQDCAGEGENALISQETISNDLLKATQEQLLQGNPIVSNVNGFILDVVAVENSSNNQIIRRKAIAKNKAGVILLQGEPSFSSNDQILINELTFYIKQNDLKVD